jgi:serine protease Do
MKLNKYLLAAVAAGALVVTQIGIAELGLFSSAQAQQSPAPASNQSNATAMRVLPDFADLVEQVGPSVVNIRTSQKIVVRENQFSPDEEMQELFKRFFGMPFPTPNAPQPQQRPKRAPQTPQEQEQPRGVGSGFILSADGFIMTNAHVVEGADKVIVTLPDKREFTAKIVGADKRSDVAVVKIDAKGLPAVKTGDVSKLRVGEWVLAIGSPFGLDNSVTAGIVSAKQRDTGEFLPFIQTDVAINPGNSGGPLINMRGEVVGINSQIYSRSGGYMGISFSIPIDEAIRVSDQLRATGHVQRGRLGVQIEQVSKEVADSVGMPKPQGVLVRGVEGGSPAEKAGVEAGDIILRFDGKNIDKPSDLPRLVGNTKPGTRSVMQVWRRGASKDLTVVVGEVGDEVAVQTKGSSDEKSSTQAGKIFGLSVSNITEAQKKELRIGGGVRVDSVTEPASRVGIQEGDVILGIANIETPNVKAFEAAVAKLDSGKAVNVVLRRGNWVQYVLLPPVR